MPKANIILMSRKDFSVIGFDYDPSIPDRGDYRNEVAKYFFEKLKKETISNLKDKGEVKISCKITPSMN